MTQVSVKCVNQQASATVRCENFVKLGALAWFCQILDPIALALPRPPPKHELSISAGGGVLTGVGAQRGGGSFFRSGGDRAAVKGSLVRGQGGGAARGSRQPSGACKTDTNRMTRNYK